MNRTCDKLRGVFVLIAALALTSAPAHAAAPPTGGAAAPGVGVAVQAKGSGGTRAAARPAPVVTAVRCLAVCGASPRTVRVGGVLQLRGRNLAAGMTVLFPAGGSRSVGSPLRRTRRGFLVTVPAGARSGRLVLTAARTRSKLFGPVHVLPPSAGGSGGAPAAGGGGADTQPSGTAFDGAGMWIWYVSKSNGGDLPSLISAAHAAGIGTLYVKSSDGGSNYWSQFSPALVQTLHQAGLRACAWQYVYGTQPAAEAALGARAASNGADCLVIDAEAEYEGKYSSAQTYIRALRAAVGPSYPIGLASFPYVDYHEQLPYSVFLGPGGAQFNLPQIYWYEIGTSPDTAMAHTYHENRVYARPIMPLGQTYGGVPAAQVYRFRQLSAAYGASGLSWWDWQETPASVWAALTQPLTALSGVSVDNTYPLFTRGARGDQVLWLQEHLAAAQPQTPTTGIFDAATQSALVAFQASRGLPQSGSTDAATWQSLLALTPVPVSWTAGAAPAG